MISGRNKNKNKKYKWSVESHRSSRKWSRNLRSWLQASALPVVSACTAGLKDDFWSPSKRKLLTKYACGCRVL